MEPEPELSRGPQAVRSSAAGPLGVTAGCECERVADRCADVDADAGCCQLLAEHAGIHAAAGAEAYYTWRGDELLAWSRLRPPFWMFGLAWYATYRPIYRIDWAS